MCRMLGIVAKSGIDASLLRDFRTLAEIGRVRKGAQAGHRDGWGIAYFDEDAPDYAGRRPRSASEDIREYEQACKRVDEKRPRIIIAHVRKASQGSCSLENTHPFIKDGWCFAHNGTIYYTQEKLKGRTDSERFFEDIVARMKEGKGVVDAIAGAVSVARELKNERGERSTSLTFLMADSTRLYGYRECSVAPEYYTMFYSFSSEMAIVAQEMEWLARKMPRVSWRELENKELLIVDADTLKMERVKIK